MKKILLILVAFCIAAGSVEAQDKVATTTALWKKPTTNDYIRARECGINYLEAALNQCYRGVQAEEVIPRMKRMKEQIDSAGMKVWSVHLPFSRTLDISVADSAKRRSNVEFMAKIIEASKMYGARYFVLHPSSEPISDQEREARIGYAVESIRFLKPYADRVGAILCIEDLPRSCLGNTPEELVRIVDQIPGVKICFDFGHYAGGTLDHFIETVGRRIATIHAYDFAEVTDMHWLPTQGTIEWGRILRKLRSQSGYKGAFVFEATKDHTNNDGPLTPEQLAESYAKIRQLVKESK